MFESCNCRHRKNCEIKQIADKKRWENCPRKCSKGWLMNPKKEMYRCDCNLDLKEMAKNISNKTEDEINPKEIFA